MSIEKSRCFTLGLVAGGVMLLIGCTSPQPAGVKETIDSWAPGMSFVYSGTFSDAPGHRGPLRCQLTRKDKTTWLAAFTAENRGAGPKGFFSRNAELQGRFNGAVFVFSGEVPMRAGGPYVLISRLSADGTLTGVFRRKAGGWPGTYSLTLETAPAQ
ncbi:MAG: hypothetical protein GXP31_06950 [Kiritimatiellaeota bacterium]|nr:hypothetical protein [Kiritimatiellota bacterium]